MEERMVEKNENAVEAEGYSFSFKWLLTTVVAVWPWFVGSVLVTLLIGNLYLRYAKPVYRLAGEVLINDNKTSSSTDESVLQGLGLNSNKNDITNVSRALKSKTAMMRVVDSLRLNFHYIELGNVKTSELYTSSPFFLQMSNLGNQTIAGSFEYKLKPLDANRFELTDKKSKWSGKWGDTLTLPVGSVAMVRGAYPLDLKSDYKIIVNSEDLEAGACVGGLSVLIPDKQSNIVDLGYMDEIPQRGEDIINTLVAVYKVMNVDEKNMIANNTVNFINDRLDTLGRELSGVEQKIQKFKENNDLTDIKEQSKMLVTSSGEYMKALSEKQVQLSVIEDLEKYLKNNANSNHLMPAPLITSDQSFSMLMARYNSLQVERGRLMLSNTENNPAIVNIDQQIAGLKADMLGALISIKNSMVISINEIRNQSHNLGMEIKGVPEKERLYLDFSRKQNIMQDIYLYLLKKREEAAISKTTNVANVTFLDAAVNNGPVSPNRSRVLMISLILGLLIPGAVIYIRKTLNNTIITKADITNNTTIPLLGEIGHYTDPEYVAVKKNDNSVLSEQFRALRTNLQFFLPDKDKKTILLTSSMSGEGKSFVAVNLAITFAISGKRVVLMELDLRKPKISKKLNLENKVGFSTYAIGKAEIGDIIIPSNVDDNLYVIPSGPIPPNPAELIMLQRIDTLFNTLKENFDYIIVDTSPIGLVIDAQLLNRFADATLYLVRQGYTYKQQLSIINDLKTSDKLPKISLVINDVLHKRGFMYGYGYGYEYGYGYKYGYAAYGDYVNDNGNNGKKRLRKLIKKNDD